MKNNLKEQGDQILESSQTKMLNEFAFPGRAMALIGNTEMEIPTPGLTKREYFAAMALQGFIAYPGIIDGKNSTNAANVIKISIQYADELLKQLESKV